MEASDAPLRVDLVRDTAIGKINERDLNHQQDRAGPRSIRVSSEWERGPWTIGMKLVDDQVTKRRTKRVKTVARTNLTMTGPAWCGAAAGGVCATGSAHRRNSCAVGWTKNIQSTVHGPSRNDRPDRFSSLLCTLPRLTRRLRGRNPVFTPASRVTDQPSTFAYGDRNLQPRNYKEEYHGDADGPLRFGHVAGTTRPSNSRKKWDMTRLQTLASIVL